MPASDPTTDVPTPTGTLQGVAAFSWDGANWQPTGRAGPSVATPTGVLRGVAAFNGGPAWQPSGRAQPGVTTPTGTLDGVAVYTWSGSAWTPPGGTATPSTPSGALRGVAAFNWDGAAWQPAGQAGPSVATPYGVLDGVAMFGWTGSAWAAVGAPSLSLDFMVPGTLDPRLTFTRASTATYFNSAGVMQTAAANAPRWDYNPSTLALNGLLIEEARTNVLVWSADASAWSAVNIGASPPVVTANQVVAPDGSATAARVVYPAVSGGNMSELYQSPTATANPYSFSVWMKGSVGGEQLYLYANAGATYYRVRVTLTTAWQRFTLNTSALTAAAWIFGIGCDLRDASQTAILAQTIYVWGAQVEQGVFPTSYIPTTAAAVTRSADLTSLAVGSWYVPPGGSWMTEFVRFNPAASNYCIVQTTASSGSYPIAVSQTGGIVQYDGTFLPSSATSPVNVIEKGATTWAPGLAKVCGNGGTIDSLGTLATGYATAGPFVLFQTTSGAQPLSGYIRQIRYWPRVLSNAEMQSVTT